MLKLPKVPYTMDKDQAVAIPFRGINFSDRLSDGDLADSFGISMRRYPFVTNKRGREKYDDHVYSATVYNGGFLKAQYYETEMYYVISPFGNCQEFPQKYANINSKVVIFPSKEYVDFEGYVEGETQLEIKSLEAHSVLDKATFGANYIQGAYTSVASGCGGRFVYEGNKFIAPTLEKIKCNVPMLINDNRIEPVTVITTQAYQIEVIEEAEYNVRIIFENSIPNVNIEKGEFNIAIIKADGSVQKITATKGYFTTTTRPGVWGDETFGYFALKTDNEIQSVSGVGNIGVYLLSDDKCDFDFTKLVKKDDKATCYSLNFAYRFTVKSVAESYIDFVEDFSGVKILTSCQIGVLNVWDTNSLGQISEGDTVRFKNSHSNTTDFVVKSVNKNEISFENEPEVAVDEDISNTEFIYILKKDSTDSFPDFKEGDAVTVSGCGEYRKDNNRTFVIDKIMGNTLYAAADIFNAGEEANVMISRTVPELDFICEAENRLWGCNSSENTIYISALGDPTNMYAYEGLSTDSFATAVGSPGEFTGCCRYSSSVLFFKEDKIHKILGSYPGDYTLYSYDVEGIQKGSDKSAVVINEVLYYKGIHGIYAYDGGVPTLISECFGEKTFYEAAAGTDGVSYYVSMRDEENVWYLFCYNTQTGIWTLEDKGFRAKDAVRVGMDLYFLDNAGVLWKENAVEDVSESEWMMQFTPFYETIQGKKIYSRLLLRAELPKGSYMVVEIRCDGGRWMELGKIVGKSDGVVPVRIPVNRCDKFEIRLRGKGEFLLREMLREYYVSSEK